MNEQEKYEGPEKRTEAFFSQNYDRLNEDLRNRIVVLYGTDKKILITEPLPYPKAENQTRMYQPIQGMNPGDLWVCPFPLRHMRLLLIVAKDGDEKGACIRIKNASLLDSENNTFVPLEREGNISNYFGLEDNERLRLRFIDDSETLYLIRGEYPTVGAEDIGITPEEANQRLETFLEK